MSQSEFQNGPWIGFYIDRRRRPPRCRMDLTLTFAAGRMTGDGVDDIGRFFVRGRYDSQTRECYWTKTYVGKHDVFYRGFAEHKGIWGVWEVAPAITGGFKIWPLGASGDEDSARERQQEEIPDAIGVRLPA